MRVERLKTRKQPGCGSAMIKEGACTQDAAMSDDAQNGQRFLRPATCCSVTLPRPSCCLLPMRVEPNSHAPNAGTAPLELQDMRRLRPWPLGFAWHGQANACECVPGHNDDSQNSGRSSPDGMCGPKALQSLSSGGSLSMQDLVRGLSTTLFRHIGRH